jgi:hypothetical protein
MKTGDPAADLILQPQRPPSYHPITHYPASKADGHALRAGIGAAGKDARFGIAGDYLH